MSDKDWAKAGNFGDESGAKAKGSTTVVLLDKLETYLTQKGYAISSEKHGFDLVGMKQSAFSINRHVVVAVNDEQVVAGDYVVEFKKKVSAYYKMICERYAFFTPHLEGLIAYTGILSNDAHEVVNAYNLAIEFKKF